MGKPASILTKAVVAILAANGWFVWKGGGGCARNKQGDWFRIGAVGAPDLYAIKGGETLFIEIKAGKDRLSPAQESFKEQVEKHGGDYLVVHHLEDMIEYLLQPSKHLSR